MKLRIFNRRPKVRRKRTNKRYVLTLKGQEGRVLRYIIIGIAAIILIIILANAMRVEPSLMNSAEIATIFDRGVLRVGVRNDMPGLAKDGEGLEIELAKLLADRVMGYHDDWDYKNDAALLIEVNSMTAAPRLNDDTADIAIAGMKKDASSRYAYSQTYYKDACLFIVKRGDETRPLEKLTIGYIQSAATSSVYVTSSAMGEALTAYISAHSGDYIEKKAFASYDELLNALANGDVDAIVLNELNVKRLDVLARFSFAIHETRLADINYAMASLTSSSALVKIADIMLNEMKADGTLRALYAKYGLEYRLED